MPGAAVDPITQSLIDAGLIDENGNWLVDPTTGQPTTGGSTTTSAAPEPDIDDIMARYQTTYGARVASGGMTEAEFRNTDEWRGFDTEIRAAIATTTDRDWLRQSRDWQLNHLDDPTFGDHYRSLSTAINTRLDSITNPLTPYLTFNFNNPNLNEGSLNADRDAIYAIAQSSYQSLLAFQQEQRVYADRIANDMRLARELAIPRAPEQSGRVVAGGSAAGRTRTDLGDLMIRY